MQQMMKCWSKEGMQKLADVLKPYWQFREHLTIEHSCITWTGRFFIPTVLRPCCLKVPHNGHPGVPKMTLRAQSTMLQPGISKQIAEYICTHIPCQTISNLQQKESAIQMEVPCRPWKVLGMDFFLHKNKWFLLVADYYSKFPYILQMSSMTSKDVISVLSFCFSVLDTPEEIICDNMANFISRECKEFATSWGFTLTTSSPTSQSAMDSLKGKCKPSRSCLPGVMKIVPTAIWLSKSLEQAPLTAICNHQQSFSSTDR